MTEPGAPVDFAFLDAQTFGGDDLAREIMALFLEQARRLLRTLPDIPRDEQTATAHLLKGSCQAIGAGAAADLLQRYDAADADGRRTLHPELATAFAAADAAIEARLAAP